MTRTHSKTLLFCAAAGLLAVDCNLILDNEPGIYDPAFGVEAGSDATVDGASSDARSDGDVGSDGAVTDARPDGDTSNDGAPTDAQSDGDTASDGAVTDAQPDGETGSDGAAADAGDDAGFDASCSSAGNCPLDYACNVGTHLCTKACGSTQTCNGGCCSANSGGTCLSGDAGSACGTSGICLDCTTSSLGHACVNGSCGCESTMDCNDGGACSSMVCN